MLPLIRADRNVRLRLTPERRQATADRDGILARRVLRALHQARHEAASPDWNGTSFPLSGFAFQAIAHKLGVRVGIKHSRAIIRRARECGLLQDAGPYESKLQRLVPTYRLGARIVGLGETMRGGDVLRSAHKQLTGGRRSPVKVTQRVRWWEHGLFGTPDRAPPRLLYGRSAAQMWARDEMRGGVLVRLRSVTVDGVVVLG